MERELIEIANILCEGYLEQPSGCEGCPLWNPEEYEKDGHDWKCDFYKLTT